MAITRVNTAKTGFGYVQNGTIANGGNVTAGNTLIGLFTTGDGDSPSYSDNNGNTWQIAINKTLSGQRRAIIAYAFNCNAGATTVTQTTASFADTAAELWEINGLTTTDPLDVTAGSASNGSSFTATTAATNFANELVIALLGVDSQSVTITGDAGYQTIITQISSAGQFTQEGGQYKTVSSTGTQSATITLNNPQNGSMAIATFKSATQPSVTNTGFLDFM